MKIIDLLNKIANGEDFKEKHIKYFDRIDQEYDICMICEANIIYKLDEASIELNDEVEIIEDKKIEKFKDYIPIGLTTVGADFRKEDVFEALMKIGNKINEIIEHINKEDK